MKIDRQIGFDRILTYVASVVVAAILTYCGAMCIWDGFLSPHAQACRAVHAIPYDDGTCRRIEEAVVKP